MVEFLQGVNNRHSFFLNLTVVTLASSQGFRRIGYGPLTAIWETVEQNGFDPDTHNKRYQLEGLGQSEPEPCLMITKPSTFETPGHLHFPSATERLCT